ncbi:MAG TPA: 1-acyl-sn-glycerol-3-phosphate acyltransferase [Candidatus Acidoferrum sp.]|nr:1-acyl-sn-glycerol-3-phosphate acyltransferase [Candidatus Acidoferrum sp.]
MQNIVIAKTYRFVPPRFSPVWWRVVQWYLPAFLRKCFGVASWQCVGAERLAASLNAGYGVLLAANHCRPCDPMVLGLLSREVARPFHVMASWHLFMQGRLLSFLLPRLGGFSVHREGLDRESLKCATRILAAARFPLVIFPEGFVTRNNDRLLNLMDGVPFLARAAAKQRADSPRPGKVVLHPVFIRYFFEGQLQASITPVLEKIEARLSWRPQSHLPLRDRIVKAGHALLALKEMEYLGATQTGAASERLRRLLDHLLEPLERKWTGGRREPDPMLRIKRLRAAILPEIIQGELTEEERASRWRQLADLYLAQQLHCYSGDYLADSPTPERLLEMVERYEEDLTDAARPHPPIHAVISVGQAIEAAPTRDRSADTDPIATELRRQLETMLEESKNRRRTQPGAATL